MGNTENVINRIELAEGFEFTEHAELVLKIRKIDKNDIIKCLKGVKNLIATEHQPDEYLGEKYKLTFIKSKRHNIIIVLNFVKTNGKEKAKIVTIYKESVKRSRVVKKWLEKKRR